jgi:hypothetical protein
MGWVCLWDGIAARVLRCVQNKAPYRNLQSEFLRRLETLVGEALEAVEYVLLQISPRTN